MATRRAAVAAAALCAAALVASAAFAVAPSTATGRAALTTSAVAPPSGSASFAGAASAAQNAIPVRAAALVALAAAGAALIVQNKGGGHGEIGYHLALKLATEKGLKVTMIQDSAAKMDKPPFSSYKDLEAAGVEIKMADLSGGGFVDTITQVSPCDYVFDNQNVCTKDVQAAVASWQPKAYAYVSSGGMYKPVPEGPLLETGEVKEDNKQLSLERNAAATGLRWSAYRPQYIYGPKTNKPDYIDWFLDRITRNLPFPLPADGSLRTTLTNAIDVAGMMSCVVGNEDAAAGQVFNCATDVRISHVELVKAICAVLAKDANEVMSRIVFYNPADLKGVELPKKGKFPFRETHFGVGVEKAKQVLGFVPQCKLEQDLEWYIAEYLAAGKDEGDLQNEWDVAVMSAAATAKA